MNKKALRGLLIVLLIPLVSYMAMKVLGTRAMVMPRHYIYDSTMVKTVDGKQVEDTLWHQIPHFSLTNQLGNQVGWKELEGKIVVADFFFTNCPTICPRLTLNMKRLQEGITNGRRVGKEKADFVHYLSFSVDPERDSVPALKQWANRFQINPDNWWLLTGPKKEIYDLSIEHMKLGAIDGEGIDTAFMHTDFMVLIDKNRNIRGYYHGLDSADMDRLSKDLVLLSLEKGPGRKKFYDGKLDLLAMAVLITLLGLAFLLFFYKKERKNNGVDPHQK